MPVLTVDGSGKTTKAVVVPHLSVEDRSIVIHAGGDSFSDQPASNSFLPTTKVAGLNEPIVEDDLPDYHPQSIEYYSNFGSHKISIN
jgi:hypothetical protein